MQKRLNIDLKKTVSKNHTIGNVRNSIPFDADFSTLGYGKIIKTLTIKILMMKNH